MASFFDRMFGRNREGSSSTAKDRLRFVLQYDRINIPPEKMEEMKREILEVISKYVAIDREKVDIALEQRDRDHSKIVAEIPFAKDRVLQIGESPNEEDNEEETDVEDSEGDGVQDKLEEDSD
jgi:cell division topological specificity factor